MSENAVFEFCRELTMAAGGWGCPHELDGQCNKVPGQPCDPGMKGCELYGRYVFFDASKNARLEQKKARAETSGDEKSEGLPKGE